MYRIMIVASKKDNAKSLYQYLTSTVNNVTAPLEFATKEALDEYVEKMLNGDYAKSDFIIVKPIEYSLTADAYSDDEVVADIPENNE
ncbi:MAG: hypothetical protein K2F81_04975 [Ruminococcus sp.]|nr:hypothetical protein [Ruminococcus sp.]